MFHEFIYGNQFEVYNDRLTLKSIFNKTILKEPPRIQRFLLRIQGYYFEINCIKVSLLTVAETLNRAPLNDEKS